MTGRRKDLQALLQLAAAGGAVVSRTGGDHFKVTTAGGVAYVSSTPRGGRSLANARAALRRIGALS